VPDPFDYSRRPAATAPYVESGAQSWGRYPRVAQRLLPLWWTDDPVPWNEPGGVLARGLGRSYGDSCLAAGDSLLAMAPCRRLLEFDIQAGLLTAEAGADLGDIAAAVLPYGWYPPVMPGTRHVTVGGAIANDIHGKNHWTAGSFGCHVRSIELRRSDRATTLRVNPGDPLFAATVGGLGLTGIIVRATIALMRVPGPGVRVRIRTFSSWDEDFACAEATTGSHVYAVEWFAPGARGGARGAFRLGEPAPGPARWSGIPATVMAVPFDAPAAATGRSSIAAFNALCFGAHARAAKRERIVPVWSYMHPLDHCRDVNRIYGRQGFIQYHCVVPRGPDRQVVPAILGTISKGGFRVFLPVMKQFGTRASPGLLSFPLPGTSLALDFPWQGERLLGLLDELDAQVLAAGGRVYLAKDARMSPSMFRQSYPAWQELERHRDPAVLSRLWQRVAG
jgi:FAD/FMN-containing dehydrogenase